MCLGAATSVVGFIAGVLKPPVPGTSGEFYNNALFPSVLVPTQNSQDLLSAFSPELQLSIKSCHLLWCKLAMGSSVLCACVHVNEKWCRKGSHSSSVSGSNLPVWLQTWKKAMGWCTVQWKMLFCVKTIVKVTQIWTSLKKEKTKKKKNILAVWWLSGLVLLRCFLVPLGVLFIMKHSKMNGRVL